MYEIVQNFILRLCRNFIDLGLLRMFLLVTFRLFDFSLCLFLLQISIWDLNNIHSVLTYSSKPAPNTRFSKLQSDISVGNGSKGLRVIEDFCPSSQPGTLRKKIICTKKVYEIDDAEICLRIYSIFFSHQL